MSSVWFVLSIGSWFVAASFAECGIQIASETSLQTTCVAGVTTAVAFFTILLFDRLGYTQAEEAKTEANDTHQAHLLVAGVIKALAILIGYAWVNAFETCIITFAEVTKHHGYGNYVRIGIPLVIGSMVTGLLGHVIVRKVMEKRAQAQFKSN
jgi:hypothetical protein